MLALTSLIFSSKKKKKSEKLRSLFEKKEAAGGGLTLLWMVSARTLGLPLGLQEFC